MVLQIFSARLIARETPRLSMVGVGSSPTPAPTSRDRCNQSEAATLQAYLGRSNIQHTVRYTELAPDRFKHFWKD